MRTGELCALKWKDIDFEENTINITKTYYNPKNNVKNYKLLPSKTITSKRKISVDQIIIEELKKHRAKQNVVNHLSRQRFHLYERRQISRLS